MSIHWMRRGVAVACVALLAAAVPPGATAQPTTLRATVDGSVIDFDGDGSGDFVYNDVGSVIVGFNAHFGAGEYRGVYNFDLDDIAPCAGGFTAKLRLSLTGTFFDGGDPGHTLYAAMDEGTLDLGDFGVGSFVAAFDAYDSVTYPISVIDVSTAVESAIAVGTSHIAFVVRPNPVSASVVGAFLYSSNEISDIYGFTPTVLETDCATPKTAAQQVDDLIALVDSYNLRLLGTALHDKLVKVQEFLAANKPKRACEKLDGFLAQVKEQRGKRISVEQADRLTLDARRIKAVIGC